MRSSSRRSEGARARACAAALTVAAVLALAAAGAARAQTDAPGPAAPPDSTVPRVAPRDLLAGETAPRDSVPRGAKPFTVLLRSAVVPGWGQAKNGAWLKVIAVVGGEGYLGYRAWRAWRKELDATDLANAAVDDAEFARQTAEADRQQNTKINFIWWTAAVHLLQTVDAYVDAHFVTFDADFGPADDAAAREAGPRLAVSLRARF